MNETLEFKALFEKTHDAVFLLDLNGNHILVNQKACDMFGYTLEEMKTLNYKSLSAEPSASSNALEKILSGEEIPIYERLFRKKSGEVIPVEINVVLVHDASKNPLYIQSTIRDISTRKRAEAEFIERSLQKQKLRMIFESSPVGIAHYSKTGVLLDCNSKLCDIAGTSRQKLVGINILEQGENPEMICAFKVAQNGGTSSFEDEYTTIVEKNVRFLRVIFNAVTPDKTPSEVIATIEDVSERIQAKKKLEEMTQFQSLILDLAISYVNLSIDSLEQAFEVALKRIGLHCKVDRAYIFTYDKMSKVFNNTLEWTEKGVSKEKENLQNIPENILANWVKKHRKGQSVLIENVALLEENDPLKELLISQHVKTLITVPFIGEGKYYGFVGFDAVKGRKNWSEEEIHLLEMIAELFTNALIKKDREAFLIQARNEAQRANAIKSTFLANMSHEFRTPLNAIIGMMSLLSKTDLQKEQEHHLNQALFFSQSLLNTLNEILDFSKIESGKMTLEEHPFNLKDFFEEVTSLMHAAATQKNLSLNYFVNKNLPDVWVGDVARLKQIFTNLLSNAIKFTDKGFIYWSVEGGPSSLLFKVIDSGIGLTEKEQREIFKPFTQADQSITRKYGGTGLGLSIVNELVDLMNGKIQVDSQLGKGTTFSLTLPLTPYEAFLSKSSDIENDASLFSLIEALKGHQPIDAKKHLIGIKSMFANPETYNFILNRIENYNFSDALTILKTAIKEGE